MPGLIRGVARTAVVAGTATVVSNRVSRRQAGRWAAQDQRQYEQQQAAAPPPEPQYAPPPEPAEPQGADMSDKLAQLKQLGELKEAGVLTEDEFQDQKAKILGS
ncbi:MAG: SHOCT domain-containing protein [Kineosporiaceae bacterium]